MHIFKILPFILLSFVLSAASAAETNQFKDPYKYFFNDSWGDFHEELAIAREQNKKAILIFFEMDECPFCHWMKENVLNHPQVQAYFRQHFLNFAVDIEGDVEMTDFQGNATTQKQFASKNRVRATPVFAIFDLHGKQIARYTGRTRNMEEFMWLGEYVVDGYFDKMSFSKFKRIKKRQKQAS